MYDKIIQVQFRFQFAKTKGFKTVRSLKLKLVVYIFMFHETYLSLKVQIFVVKYGVIGQKLGFSRQKLWLGKIYQNEIKL